MGRKTDYKERIKPGPGRKTKKQGEPTFSAELSLKAAVDPNKKLSSRQKKRLKKRELKKEDRVKKVKPVKKEEEEEEEEESDEGIDGIDDDEVNEEELESDTEDLGMTDKFTDDNAAWLKPSNKRKLLEDSDEEEEEAAEFDQDEPEFDADEEDDEDSDDDDDDDDDDDMKVEKASKKLQSKQAKMLAEGEEEMHLNLTKTEKFQLPSGQEIEKEAQGAPDLQIVQGRIREVISVLQDFKARREEGVDRQTYLNRLKKDLCTYYNYNDFMIERFMQVFQITEIVEVLEANEVQRPVTIRTNSLKTRRRDLAQALISRGVNLDPVGKWSKVGLVVYSSTVPLGATPEYLAGHYILQGASSLLPVMALAPQVNERVLDMASAPGGKTTHIAAIMNNTGMVLANDANKERCKAVVGNCHRLGITNTVICNYDGRKLPKIMSGFDRVLLDAPCSGTGVISKDESAKLRKDDQDIHLCSHLQKELILAAVDCLDHKSKTGGYLVYSTCSVLPEENENVVDYVLRKRHVKLVPTGLDFGVEGFTKYREKRYHPSMNLCKRYYPHTHNMDGFFVAKIKKLSNKIPDQQEDQKKVKKAEATEEEVKDSGVESEKEAETSPSPTPAAEGTKTKRGKKNKDSTSEESPSQSPAKKEETTKEKQAKRKENKSKKKAAMAVFQEDARPQKKKKMKVEEEKPAETVAAPSVDAESDSKALSSKKLKKKKLKKSS